MINIFAGAIHASDYSSVDIDGDIYFVDNLAGSYGGEKDQASCFKVLRNFPFMGDVRVVEGPPFT